MARGGKVVRPKPSRSSGWLVMGRYPLTCLPGVMQRVTVTDTGCWEWNGARDPSGYGKASFEGRKRNAHRIIYELHRARIPYGFDLDHLCRNRPCVNPDHLEAVTRAENMRRVPRG